MTDPGGAQAEDARQLYDLKTAHFSAASPIFQIFGIRPPHISILDPPLWNNKLYAEGLLNEFS